MTASVRLWSTTPGSNSGLDSGADFPEGMARSQVNDMARGIEAAVKKLSDDLSGKKTSAGTANAMTLTTAEVLVSGDLADGLLLAFWAGTTNTGATTLALDAVAAKNVVLWDGSALTGGEITAGQLVIVAYSTTAGKLYLVNPSRSATLVNTIPNPQGRLSLATATPVHITDQSAKTSVFWCLYGGNLYPWYNATRWTMRAVAELSLALDSNAGHTGYQQSGKVFDLFLTNDAGTDRLVSGPAWTNDSTRSAAVSQVNGVYVNTSSMTTKFDTSASNLTVAASQGTLVGTMRASADGQTQILFGGIGASGSQAFIGIWNYYNRVSVEGLVADSTDNWTYTTATVRAANASNTMRFSFVSGMAEDAAAADYATSYNNNNASVTCDVGIGYDVTNAFSGRRVLGVNSAANAFASVSGSYAKADIGFHFMQACEYSTATGTTTWEGDVGSPTLHQTGLTYRWRY